MKLRCGEPLSNVAFQCNLRRYIKPLCDLIVCSDARIVTVALEAGAYTR